MRYREKFIEKRRLKINEPITSFKKKNSKFSPKGRRMKIIKINAEINELENKCAIEKIKQPEI